MPSFKIDDILAALILSLAMMRRIEVRTARAEDHPRVPREAFRKWRRQALRAYDQLAIASFAKVVLSVAWFVVATRWAVPTPWFQIPGVVLFVAWICAIVWAWKLGTDARHLRLSLGIELKRRASAQER